MDDQKLLREYVLAGSQSAFRTLVNRHIGLVYSAALRMVHDAHLADTLTHRVFATLARKADSLNPADVLARWLHDTTRRLATHDRLTAAQGRGEGQVTAAAGTLGAEGASGRIVDDLEAMMDKLPPPDRDAIVPRYLENHSLHDVAGMLGLSEEAADARVNHAVAQLDAGFKDHGVPIASAVLATVLASECAAHVPIGLSIAVGTEALEAAATVPARRSSANWRNGRTAAYVCLALLLVGAGVFVRQQGQVTQLKSENERLLGERKKLKAESAAVRALAATEGNIELVLLRRSDSEVLRLRREVALLRAQIQGVPPPAPAPDTPALALTSTEPHEPGVFIASADLNFTGYSTPEAAMESIVWCLVAGSYDAFLTALSPDDRATELDQPDGRERFAERQQQAAPLFKGMQVSALKVLSDDEVELKVLLDFGTQRYHIQPLVRINGQWRPSDSTRDYDSEWDADGKIQPFTPP